MEEPERQPYIHWTTCYDYRGDVDYRRVLLQMGSENTTNLLEEKQVQQGIPSVVLEIIVKTRYSRFGWRMSVHRVAPEKGKS